MPEFFQTRFGVGQRHPLVRLPRWIEQAAIRFADHAITPTAPMRKTFIDRDADPRRVSVLLNTADETVFDAARFPPRPREPGQFTLISRGTIEERYGLDTAIRAVALLGDEIPGLRLAVYGEGSFRPDLE
jgi:glycosyltransferase involved in cell wall biosynthesis